MPPYLTAVRRSLPPDVLLPLSPPPSIFLLSSFHLSLLYPLHSPTSVSILLSLSSSPHFSLPHSHTTLIRSYRCLYNTGERFCSAISRSSVFPELFWVGVMFSMEGSNTLRLHYSQFYSKNPIPCHQCINVGGFQALAEVFL